MMTRALKLLGPEEYPEGIVCHNPEGHFSGVKVVGFVDPSQAVKTRWLGSLPVFNSLGDAALILNCDWGLYDDVLISLPVDVGVDP